MLFRTLRNTLEPETQYVSPSTDFGKRSRGCGSYANRKLACFFDRRESRDALASGLKKDSKTLDFSVELILK